MNNPGRLLLGIGLLAAGILFLLDLGDIVNASSIIGTWWPLAVIAFGVTALIGPSRSMIGGSIITFAGVVLLIASLGLLPVSPGELVFPLILISVGLGLLLIRSRTPSSSESGTEGKVGGFAIFASQNIVSRADTISSGAVTSIFGSAELDLRATQPAPGGAGIEVFTVFGSITIIVPRGWRVTVNGMPLFASFEDNIDRSVEPAADAPHLEISGVAVFGSVEVTHQPD
jgi:predicted membrane protein